MANKENRIERGGLITRLMLVIILALGLVFATGGSQITYFGAATALADDGDGDGDSDGDGDGDGGDDSGDDGDDGDGGSASSGTGGTEAAGRLLRRIPGLRNVFRDNRSASRRNQAGRNVERATRAPDEIIAAGLDDDDVETLTSRGYAVIERRDPGVIASPVVRFRIPRGIALEEARNEVAAIREGVTADFNHYYRTSSQQAQPAAPETQCQGNGCREKRLISWPVYPGGAGSCTSHSRIGLIDTGINPDHDTFEEGSLVILGAPREGLRKSSRRHGTAIASILIGSAESRSPGLLQNATIYAVDAFYRDKSNDERSDAFILVDALELIAQEDVSVINMSLAGPPNAVLEKMITALADRNIVVVAAAGNSGPRAKPSYPAAYRNVVAVTAVDSRMRIFRRAGRGDHIDFAGPGVNVWIAASVRGARSATGTSFAVPFVSAAVALAQQGLGATGHGEVMDALTERARDLGKPGRDEIFGHGLLQTTGLCNRELDG